MLWFDVEKRYNTTILRHGHAAHPLWFDVEKRYNTTVDRSSLDYNSCGLM